MVNKGKEEEQKKPEESSSPDTRESKQTGAGKSKGSNIRIDIFKAWCKACGICVAFCPTGGLAKDEAGYPYVKDIEKCINCGWCEIRCPDFAITVEKKVKAKKRVGEKGEEESTGSERVVASGQ
jgi:2-oxoglutarate ferredoxin oxidoreductase subunit delta